MADKSEQQLEGQHHVPVANTTSTGAEADGERKKAKKHEETAANRRGKEGSQGGVEARSSTTHRQQQQQQRSCSGNDEGEDGVAHLQSTSEDRLPPSKDATPDLLFRVTDVHLRRFIRWVRREYPLHAIGFVGELLFTRIDMDRARQDPAYAQGHPEYFAHSINTNHAHDLFREDSSAKSTEDKDEEVKDQKEKREMLEEDRERFRRSVIATIAAKITEDKVLGPIIHSLRVYPIITSCPANNIKALAKEMELPADARLRLLSAPRKEELAIADALLDSEDIEVDLAPRWSQCTHILTIVPWANRWLFSLAHREAFVPYFRHKDEALAIHTKDMGEFTPISRAYYKLNEVLLRRTFKLTREMTTIDVGAAPGGWSQRMAQEAGLVVAVDPGAIEIPHVTVAPNMQRPTQPGTIVHVAKRMQESQDALQLFGPFHMYTCDMNVEFAVVLDLLSQMRPHLADGALTVVTVKLFRKMKNMLAVIRDAQEKIRRLGFGSIQVLHLFANKKKEFTVIALKLSDQEKAAQDKLQQEYLLKHSQQQQTNKTEEASQHH